jgi:hypothetical protein
VNAGAHNTELLGSGSSLSGGRDEGLTIHGMEVSANLIEASEGKVRTVIDDP